MLQKLEAAFQAARVDIERNDQLQLAEASKTQTSLHEPQGALKTREIDFPDDRTFSWEYLSASASERCWQLYSDEENAIIERAFSGKHPLVALGLEKVIVFEEHMEMNSQRPANPRTLVRRRVAPSERKHIALEGTWLHWDLGASNWTPYVGELNEKIERAFLSGEASIEFDSPFSCVIDFATFFQFDLPSLQHRVKVKRFMGAIMHEDMFRFIAPLRDLSSRGVENQASLYRLIASFRPRAEGAAAAMSEFVRRFWCVCFAHIFVFRFSFFVFRFSFFVFRFSFFVFRFSFFVFRFSFFADVLLQARRVETNQRDSIRAACRFDVWKRW